MVHILGQTPPKDRIHGIYKELRALDDRWGRLEHRLVRVHAAEWAWTCPGCRKDHVYSLTTTILYDGMAECCEMALQTQFPPWKSEYWARVWAEHEARKVEDASRSEESVRLGGDGAGGEGDQGGDPSSGLTDPAGDAAEQPWGGAQGGAGTDRA